MSKINVVQMVEFIVELWGFYTTLGDCVGTTDDNRRGVKRRWSHDSECAPCPILRHAACHLLGGLRRHLQRKRVLTA